MTPESIIADAREAEKSADGAKWVLPGDVVLQLCDAYEALRAKVEGLERDAAKLQIYEVAINRIAAQGPSMTPRETWVHWSTIAQQAIDAAMAEGQVRT